MKFTLDLTSDHHEVLLRAEPQELEAQGLSDRQAWLDLGEEFLTDFGEHNFSQQHLFVGSPLELVDEHNEEWYGYENTIVGRAYRGGHLVLLALNGDAITILTDQ